jgi:hypothetical protein
MPTVTSQPAVGPANPAFANSIGSYYRKAAQKSGSNTLIKVDTVIHDPGSHFDSEVGYKVSEAGYYLVIGQITYETIAAAEDFIKAKIKLSGTEVLKGTVTPVSYKKEIAATVSGIIHAEAGEIIELIGFIEGTEENLVVNQITNNRLDVLRVG